jgi:hypothetical protein
LTRDLKELLIKLDTVPLPKAEEAKQARDEFLKKHPNQCFELAWAAFDLAAADLDLHQSKLRALTKLLDELRPPPLFLETIYLQRLAAWKVDVKAWSPSAVHSALVAEREAEKVAAVDPRALPWVKAGFTSAADTRHEAEVLIFSPHGPNDDKAATLFQEAEQAFKAVHKQAEVACAAYRVLDQALALLPVYVPYLVDRPEGEPDPDWIGAVQSVVDLQRALGQVQRDAPRDSFAKPLRELQGHLANLARPFQHAAVDHLIEQTKKGGTREYKKIQALLKTSCLPAADRVALLKAGQALAGRLNEATAALDRDEDASGQRTPAPPKANASGAALRRKKAKLFASLSINQLQLAGLAEAAILGKEVEEAAQKDTDNAWSELGHKLRKALAKGWVDDTRSAGLRGQEARDFRAWLGGYYRHEARRLLGPPGHASFYYKLFAEELRDISR